MFHYDIDPEFISTLEVLDAQKTMGANGIDVHVIFDVRICTAVFIL